MKKILTMMAAAILFTISANAQPPELEIDYSSTVCSNDFEIRVIGIEQGPPHGAVGGWSDWVPLTTVASGNSWVYADFSWSSNDPGTPSSTNDWIFDGVEIRNCNTPSTGTTGPHCGDGNLDGIMLSFHTGGAGCFMYSSNCTDCSSGAELNCHVQLDFPTRITTYSIVDMP